MQHYVHVCRAVDIASGMLTLQESRYRIVDICHSPADRCGNHWRGKVASLSNVKAFPNNLPRFNGNPHTMVSQIIVKVASIDVSRTRDI